MVRNAMLRLIVLHVYRLSAVAVTNDASPTDICAAVISAHAPHFGACRDTHLQIESHSAYRLLPQPSAHVPSNSWAHVLHTALQGALPTAHALRRIVRMFSHRAVTHLSWQERNGQ